MTPWGGETSSLTSNAIDVTRNHILHKFTHERVKIVQPSLFPFYLPPRIPVYLVETVIGDATLFSYSRPVLLKSKAKSQGVRPNINSNCFIHNRMEATLSGNYL